jgi:prepilin-type N-terminal cleavage/methylation domain-containing protein
VFERYRELQERRTGGESPESGFTLIELLIVIVVLGILAAIVIFSLTGVTGQSAQAACNTDAKSVETAVAAYEANPPTGIAAGTAPTQIAAVTSGTNTGLVPNYLHAAPTATAASNGYAITLTTGGVVNVVTGTGTSAVTTAYDSQSSTSSPQTGCYVA